MNWIISFAVLTSPAIFIDCKPSESPFDLSSQPPTCTEGTSWMDDCNECTCVNGHPACTQMACPPRPARKTDRKKREVTTEDVINHELKKNEKCSVGTIWTSNCVNCNCGEDGPHCIAIDGCTPGPITTSKTNCEEGDDWMEDCNHCWCNKGIAACTRKLCDSHPHYPMVFPPVDDIGAIGQEKLVSKREASTGCKPGDTWMDDCNQCTCNKEGKASCSRMLCEKDHPEEIPWLLEQDHEQQHASKREAACKPGTVWIKMTDNDEGCAKFTCHDDGSVTSVPHFTREMCPSEPLYIEDDEDQQQQHVSKREAACKPGTVWIKMTDNDEGCAKFTCHDDGSVTSVPHFTREMCPSEPQYIEDDEEQQQQHVSKREAACKPGTQWIKMTDTEGCAEFTCHNDGSVTSKPHFSRELCPSEPHYIKNDEGQQQQHVSKREAACKPGDTWMDDCNQCTCNNEGKASCSRKLCEKDHPEEIPWLLEQGQQQQHVSKREATCKPGTVWIKMTDNDEGCAKFTCHDDGSVTSVPHFTREMCPSEPLYIEDDKEQQQQHVSKREADGDIVRSLRKRMTILPPPGCQPGQSYFDGCNRCVCTASGPPACTYKICPPDSQIQTVNFSQIPGLSASS